MERSWNSVLSKECLNMCPQRNVYNYMNPPLPEGIHRSTLQISMGVEILFNKKVNKSDLEIYLNILKFCLILLCKFFFFILLCKSVQFYNNKLLRTQVLLHISQTSKTVFEWKQMILFIAPLFAIIPFFACRKIILLNLKQKNKLGRKS